MTSPDPDPTSPPSEAPARPATLLEVFGAVLGSFLGIRKGKAMRRDAVTIQPLQVVVVGVVAAALLVVALLVLVRVVIGQAGG